MAEYMKIGGFTPPKKIKVMTKSPAVKRFDSLDRLPAIVETDKAMTPIVPRGLKVPKKNEGQMRQALDYVAAYNRLKAQFRQESGEGSELPYIFDKQVLGDIARSKLGAAAFDDSVDQLPRSQLEHYKNQINLFDDLPSESPRAVAFARKQAVERASLEE